MVARGFTQHEGIDYLETFSPVVKMTSLRVLISLAAIHDYFIHQMDVSTAFLHGHLKEEIYLEQPEGYLKPGQESKVCKLLKSLYGLKQASRVWYERFNNYLLLIGYTKCHSDSNVYIKRNEDKLLFVTLGLYIDDLVIFQTALHIWRNAKLSLQKSFP